MSKDRKDNQQKPLSGTLDQFEPGGALGPIEDHNEREQRRNSLPPEQRELAVETSRFADLCQYLSQQHMDVPPQILEQAGRLSKLTIADRIRVLKDINRELMEYLNDVGQDPGVRQ